MNEPVTACNAVHCRLPGRAVLVTAAALLLVVRTAAAAAPAAIEAAPWALYRTPHFEVMTTQPEARVARLIGDIALFRAVVITLLGDGAEELGARRVRFLVLDRPGDVQFLFGSAPGVTGFTRPGLAGDLMVIGRPTARRSFGVGNQVVFHEYVHQLVQMRSHSRHPAWYGEGIADFLSTLERRGDRVVIGTMPESRRFSLQREAPMALADVLEAGSTWALPARQRSAFYAQAWLLVHHLLLAPDRDSHEFAQGLATYLEAHDRGEPSRQAFSRSFSLPLEDFPQRLQDHLRRLPTIDYPLAAFSFDARYERRLLSARERTLVLARYVREANPGEALRMLAGVSTGDDARVLAAQAVTQAFLRDAAAATATIQAAQCLAPDDFVVWLETGRLYRRLCTQDAVACADKDYLLASGKAFGRAHALDPDDVEARTRHAQYLLQTPDRGDALPLLAESLAEAPWSFEILHAIGIAYLARGRLDHARIYLDKALGWSVDYPDLQADLSRLLRDIEILQAPRDD